MSLRIRYLGVSGFEIVTGAGTRVVVDPFLDGSEAKGIPPSPVTLDDLDGTHAVAVSHGAWDHLGQAVEITRRSGAVLCCGVDVRVHAMKDGIADESIRKMIPGTTFTVRDISIRALPASHVSFFSSHGEHLSAQPLSFLIRAEPGIAVYHSGDTSLFGDLKLFGELYRPDVALLCVGGTEDGLAPLPPDEAAIAADWLNARVVVPMHFRPGDPEPKEFRERLGERRPDIAVRMLEPGEDLTVDEGVT
ncbi:MAG: MBL fold metallo-hydrolase [Actinomycetota bacterium]